MSATIDSKFSKSLVIGGSGLVGGYILQHLVRVGERPLALSRSRRISPNVDWFRGDLEAPEELKFPQFSVLFCTASAILFSSALPYLLNPQLKRAVVFTSTSVLTKLDSEVIAEREMIQNLAASEQKIIATCEKSNIAWTILRPTLIYDPGRDANITPLSRLIERFGFMPLVGAASGLRQPV